MSDQNDLFKYGCIIIKALFIAEVFQRREIPEEFIYKKRLIGKYAFVKGDVELGNIREQRPVDIQISEEVNKI